MKAMYCKHASVVLAAISLGAGAAGADTLTWGGLSGSTSSWATEANWTSDGAHTFPEAGDLAQLHVNISAHTLINIGGGAAVGSLSAQPSSGIYRIRSTEAGTRTFTFDNLGSESVVTVSHSANFSTNTGLLQFGTDANAMTIALANDLRINNNGARVANGRLDFGSQTTITGGSVGDRRTITVEALGSSAITLNVGGAATFVGDWVVDGAKATLRMNTDAFGDASNGVALRDGGTLDLDPLTAVTWERSLGGTGTVRADDGLTLGSGSVLDIALTADEVSDLISVVGAVTLGGSLDLTTLGGYTPQAGDSWTILSATGGITGAFTSPLPVGYVADIVGNDLVLSYLIPEPAGVALMATGLLAIASRRRS